MRAYDQAWDARVYGGLLAADETALADAYDALAPLVYGIALRSTGDKAVAEDLSERVFLRLWERPMEFPPERGSLRVLVCELARRWAVEHNQRAGRSPGADALALVSTPESAAAAGMPRETGVVREALLSLPAQQRNAILLAYFHGLDYRQVARELDIPEDTARIGLHSGLDRLAALLNDPTTPGLSGHYA